MANHFPCLNPTCTHVFSAAEVQASPSLKCPKCGGVFQFRSPAANPKPASAKATPPPATRPIPPPAKPKVQAPVAKPAPPVPDWLLTATPPQPPVAAPIAPAAAVAPVVPLAKPVAVQPPASAATAEVAVIETAPSSPTVAFESVVSADTPFLRTRLPKNGGWSRVVIPAFMVLAVAGLVAGGYFVVKQLGNGSPVVARNRETVKFNINNVKNQQEAAFELVLAKNAWKSDAEIKTRMGAQVVMKHNEDPTWFAVAARDYGQFKPREAELLRLGIERLENYFGESLELEAKAEPTTLADIPGQRLTFKGQMNSVNWWGDIIMVAHNGMGYWLYVSAPTKDEAREAFKKLQEDKGGLVLANERKGWREQPPKIETFRSGNGLLSLAGPEGLFESRNAKDEDERGEMLLFGRYRHEKDNRKNATVMALGLEGAGDLNAAFKVAKDYVEGDKQKENKDYKLLPAEGDDPKDETIAKEPVGNRPGRSGEYKLSIRDEAKRYVLLAVVKEGELAYAVRCECTWESRQIWRQDFVELLRTLKVKGAAKSD